jgi:hypothetical protein
MLCMASLLRDYKSELEDILVADKQVRWVEVQGECLATQPAVDMDTQWLEDGLPQGRNPCAAHDLMPWSL